MNCWKPSIATNTTAESATTNATVRKVRGSGNQQPSACGNAGEGSETRKAATAVRSPKGIVPMDEANQSKIGSAEPQEVLGEDIVHADMKVPEQHERVGASRLRPRSSHLICGMTLLLTQSSVRGLIMIEPARLINSTKRFDFGPR